MHFFRSGNFPLRAGNLRNKAQEGASTGTVEGGKEMKSSIVGTVAAWILMIVTGIGFGIAQAAEIQSEQPDIRLEDMGAAQGATSPAEDPEQASERRESVPGGDWSGSDWQAGGPVGTGAIPMRVFEEHWMKEYGND
jgi:hypothetical protein